MNPETSPASSTPPTEEPPIRKRGGWTILFGILTLLIGFLFVFTPFIAGLAATIWIGAGLIVGGLFAIFHAFSAGDWKATVFQVLWGLLSGGVGIWTINQPVLSLAILTLVLAAYLAAEAIIKVAQAVRTRPKAAWLLMLFDGVVTGVLAALIWYKFPASALWAIGLLVGVKFLVDGMAMIALGTTARRLAPHLAPGPAASQG